MSPLSLEDTLLLATTVLLATGFSYFRYSVNIGLAERPLVIGMLWGMVTGDPAISMAIALFFELLWLDLFPAGTFIPPQSVTATFIALGLVRSFGLATPASILLPLAAAVPAAWLGAHMESLYRKRRNRYFNHLLLATRSRSRNFKPHHFVKRSLVHLGLANLGVFSAYMAGACLMLVFAVPHWERLMRPVDISWGHLWLAASLGGVLSLRWRRAYAYLGAGALLVAGAVMFLGLGA